VIQIPTVRIELEGMRQQITHAFINYQADITGAVDAALKKAINDFDFQSEVQRVAQEVLASSVRGAVEAAIWQAFNHETRDRIVAPIVRKALRAALR
jgi:hypothetical protein